MESEEIRKRFLEFFRTRGHAVVPSSSLIPDDPSVLLTTAGMQQFKKYYTEPEMADRDFGARNTVSIQKSFRTSDIDEVGDESHLTFFEMMGNFSFGGYFKKEAIEYAHEFITSEVGLQIFCVTVFEGLESIGVPEDKESAEIWQKLDSSIVIKKEGIEEVFWGPTGSSGPCGPTTEIYCRNSAGKDVEIWNLVFNEFFFPGSREELLSGVSDKKLEPLKTPGVDTGMGLERLAMIAQRKKNIFETDAFSFIMSGFPEALPIRTRRIIADHIRAAVFLISDGVRPSNKEAGYVLRRLLRRVIAFAEMENIGCPPQESFQSAVEAYKGFPDYSNLDFGMIAEIYNEEYAKFLTAAARGRKEFEKEADRTKAEGRSFLSPAFVFGSHQSAGVTIDIIKDWAEKEGIKINEDAFMKDQARHKEISRAGAEAKFGGHGLYLKTGEVTIRDKSEVEKVTRLHTATHLLHAGLRAVLGSEARQDGSDITVERTRFDLRFSRKITPEELRKTKATRLLRSFPPPHPWPSLLPMAVSVMLSEI